MYNKNGRLGVVSSAAEHSMTSDIKKVKALSNYAINGEVNYSWQGISLLLLVSLQ